jgi:tRNA(fMet)-specific endonuclease VapC
MRYLLDTNTCIAAIHSHPYVVARMQAISPSECAVSTITSYELFTGALKCSNPAVEQSKVELLFGSISEMGFDSNAAREAARIRATLASQGQKIGPYHLLLAGQAVAGQLILVTNNTREFRRVVGLTVEDWCVAPTPGKAGNR